jgi:hypothetical protein
LERFLNGEHTNLVIVVAIDDTNTRSADTVIDPGHVPEAILVRSGGGGRNKRGEVKLKPAGIRQRTSDDGPGPSEKKRECRTRHSCGQNCGARPAPAHTAGFPCPATTITCAATWKRGNIHGRDCRVFFINAAKIRARRNARKVFFRHPESVSVPGREWVWPVRRGRCRHYRGFAVHVHSDFVGFPVETRC